MKFSSFPGDKTIKPIKIELFGTRWQSFGISPVHIPASEGLVTIGVGLPTERERERYVRCTPHTYIL